MNTKFLMFLSLFCTIAVLVAIYRVNKIASAATALLLIVLWFLFGR